MPVSNCKGTTKIRTDETNLMTIENVLRATKELKLKTQKDWTEFLRES